IEETSSKFGLNFEVINQNVFKFLEKQNQNFDIIFADPPYDLPYSEFKKITNLIFDGKWLKKEGILILEHSKEYNFEEHPNFESSRNYGSNSFSFFE
ncbi:MAG: RsmD family RNA methyltransferase, partial [Flavobacteriaceae bacterium]